MNLNELAEECHKTALEKGWWDKANPFGQQMMNIIGEVSEAWEEYRNGYDPDFIYNEDGKPEGIPIEFADAIIRLLDTCAYYDIDIEQAIKLKMAYNKTRPYRHGGKKA